MPWKLRRRDGHGNEFAVRGFDDHESSKTRATTSSRGHHQHYWIKDTQRVEVGESETGHGRRLTPSPAADVRDNLVSQIDERAGGVGADHAQPTGDEHHRTTS
jgi:hypothetical protein